MAELLTKEQERELISAAQAGDNKAKNILIERNMGLCGKWAGKYQRPFWMEVDDLVQEGVFGLHRAIQKFDLNKDTRFSTYAVNWVRQAIKRHLEKNYYHKTTPSYLFGIMYKTDMIKEKWLLNYSREPTQEEMIEELGCTKAHLEYVRCARTQVISLDTVRNEDHDLLDFIPNDYKFEPDTDRKICISECINQLDPEDRELIEHRYGLNGKTEKTLKELGELQNITRQGIQHKESLVMKKLRIIVKDMYQNEAPDLLRS